MEVAYKPASLEEALNIVEERNAIPLAGGTDLMVHRRSWSGLPPRFEHPVVFIGHLDALIGIELEDGILSIGAANTLTSILEHREIPPLFRASIRQIAGPAIRNRATIGGNICNASPAADTLPAFYVLGAEAVLVSTAGTRVVPIEKFIEGPGKTCLRRGELLSRIRVPADQHEIWFFRKVGTRAAYSCSKLSLAAVAHTEKGLAAEVRLALGSIAPTVIRSREAEAFMRAKTAGEIDTHLPRILEYYDSLIDPIDDQRSSAAYRRDASLRLVRYFIRNILLPHIEGTM